MSKARRKASHAGSWYEDDGTTLDDQLSTWLSQVDPAKIPLPPTSVIDVGYVIDDGKQRAEERCTMPIQGLKAIIAPHAGYAYSGPPAAWAYKCIDPSKYDRVFVLGPSHHVYLDGCALSACDTYETPIGSLRVDQQTSEKLRQTGKFARDMDIDTDEDEHSIEMHLPYIRKVFEDRQDVQIVPILVGSISAAKEDAFGKLLAPYLEDERTLFVVSSDFCHWGSRFRYTYYKPTRAKPARHVIAREQFSMDEPPLHASIRALDGEAIVHLTYPSQLPEPDASNYAGVSHAPSADAALATSTKRTAKEAQKSFTAYLRSTSNTICGRHPIGVLLGALAALEANGVESELQFTRYEQSSKCLSPRDSSVSYGSAFVRLASRP